MAYAPHALVALCGSYTTGATPEVNEVWQFGVRVYAHGDPSPSYLDDPQAYCDGIQAAIGTWFHTVVGIPNYVQLDTLKVNNIAPDGTYLDPVTHLHDYTSPPVGITAANANPTTSLVWSWTTDKKRGRACRGRVYPPNGAQTLSAGGVVSSAIQTAQVGFAKDLLDILVGQTDTGGILVSPCIASKFGELETITGVKVGQVLDTQRRRRNRMGENYVAQAWP